MESKMYSSLKPCILISWEVSQETIFAADFESLNGIKYKLRVHISDRDTGSVHVTYSD